MMAKIGLDSVGVIAGIGLISKALLSLNVQVGETGELLKGLGAAIVVVGIVKSLEDIAEAGGKVNHQLEMMKSIGMTAAQITAATAQANLTALEVPTTHLSENQIHLQEIRYIMGDPETANKFLTDLSKINETINNIKGNTKDSIFDLAKSLEIKNLTPNPEEFMAYAHAMESVIKASGGKVTAQQFRSAIQYGRVAAQGWDKEFIEGPLGRMVQEYSMGSGGGGGGTGGPGNALMSMYAALIQGKMTKEASLEFAGLGLGYLKGQGLDKERGRDVMMNNPYKWVQEYLMPALAAKGITDQNAIISEISKLFGVRTAAGIATNMALGGSYHVPGTNAEGQPNAPYEKDIALNKLAAAMGEPYDELIKKDYPMIMKAFTAEWTHLLEVIGSQLMQPDGPVIHAMAGLVTAFATLDKFFSDNPKVVDALLIAMAGVAAAFAAFAVGAVITGMAYFLPGALAAAAVAGIAAAFTALAAVNWESVKKAASVLDYIGHIKLIPDWMMPHNWVKPDAPADLKQNNSFYGNGITGPMVTPANFNPGDKKQILQPIQMTLNIDGQQIAHTISDLLEDLSLHPVGPPDANGWDHFRTMGNQTDT